MGHTETMAGLHPQPEALAEPEETAEAQIGIRRNRSPPFEDGVDAAFSDSDGDGEPVLAEAYRPQEFFQQYLPRRHKVSGIQRYRRNQRLLPKAAVDSMMSFRKVRGSVCINMFLVRYCARKPVIPQMSWLMGSGSGCRKSTHVMLCRKTGNAGC